jgi:hypothetical protein
MLERLSSRPVLCPGHASSLTIPSTGCLPSAVSAAGVTRLCSMHPGYYAAVRLLTCSPTALSPRLPVAARQRSAPAGQMRSPRFRRVPFERDMVFDPGVASAPRIAVPHILPSATVTASAPANFGISWLNPTPHAIAVYASTTPSPTPSQHSLPGGRYPLPEPVFHRLDHASLAWRTTVTVILMGVTVIP